MLGLEENFKALVLVMHFLKHANMQQQMKKFVKTYDMCQSKLFEKIYKNAKKSRKGRQEWAKACVNSGLPPRKLNTSMKTR
jgi:hypothetical protein